MENKQKQFANSSHQIKNKNLGFINETYEYLADQKWGTIL